MPRRKPRTAQPLRPPSDLWIYVLLAAAVFAIYSQVVHFDFVTFDDPAYVTENPHVQAGLSLAGAAWAFGSSAAGSWFPLTWLSHMLDCQLFGLDGGWHHFTNLWIHALSTLLWFTVLKRITAARSKSALVAFLFGLHPLHVESVAWVCERKDVLSALFCVLTLWAYAGYVARPSRGRYLLTLLLFCLGLMVKPMLVTLPIVLLLLDRWPFRRGVRILEKLPFFAASIAVSAVTYLVHRQAGALASFEVVPLAARLENALVSYAVYIFKMVWPVNLAVFYPYSQASLVAPAVVAGIVIAAITVLVIRVFPRWPYLAVGWLWYLVTLLPVIGLVQAGAQARADRFTYIPMIGVFIALVWGAAEALAAWPRIRLALTAVVCSACLVLTWLQVGYWRDSISLYQHAIEVTTDNYVARFNLASVLEARGSSAEAVAQLRETVRIRPYFASARAELGQLLARQGQPQEALGELQKAVRLKPDSAEAHFRLGSVLGTLGRTGDAAAEFAETVRLQPENADAHYNLGIALAQQDKLPDAAREFSATVRLRPDDVDARFNLGITLGRSGRLDESIVQLSAAVRIKPDFTEARQALEDAISLKQRSGKQ
ncbi:MAG: tetratricopeptide repeat protein [Bryobacteraceae bacterium]